jgi:hypothetical protein
MDRKATYKQWMVRRHDKYIAILKHLEKDIGKERLLDMLKQASFEENVKLGKRLSSRIKSMKVFAGPFRNENSGVGRTIVREVVEDFGLPVGLNPKFKLIRTKTLMQGHDCCNHRYIWGD